MSLKNQRGFTIIELLVSLSVVAILSAIGIASYIETSRSATLESASADLKSTLVQARSKALSQDTPESCLLKGYQVEITSDGYTLQAECETRTENIKSEQFPVNVTASPETTIYFPILTGGASGGSVSLSAYGKTRTITIDKNGTIR